MRKTAASIFALSIAACSCVWAGFPVSRTGEVQIGIENLFTDGGPNEPMAQLANALRLDKKSRRFRVSWGIHDSMSSFGASAAYDRRRHTVRCYKVEHLRVSEEPVVRWRRESSQDLYRGVTDVMISRLAAKNQTSTSGDGDVFYELTRFGCTKRRLKYSSQTETLK